MKKFGILIIILIALGCSDTKKCENAMCTEVFAMVTIKVSDTTNASLKGVNTQTILVSTGETVHTQAEPTNFPGFSFVVVDDSDLKELGFEKSQKVELKIMKDGNVLKNVPFTIKTDCCHVNKSDGPDEVSLN